MSEVQALSPGVQRVLSAAGWTDQRDAASEVAAWSCQLTPAYVLFPAAERALRCFGGLHVLQDGEGEECARESFELNPLLAVGEEARFREQERRLGTRLYPLGEAGNGHVFLAVASDGRVFALMEGLWLLGEHIEQALETLVRGRSPKPIMP